MFKVLAVLLAAVACSYGQVAVCPDNLGCPVGQNLRLCLSEARLCMDLAQCSEEFRQSLLLNCTEGTFACSDGLQVPFASLCNGSSECSDRSDETNPLCQDNCIIQPNGGCPLTRQCTSTITGVECGACLDRFEDNAEDPQGDCLEIVVIGLQSERYTVDEDVGETTVCVAIEIGRLVNRSIEIRIYTTFSNAGIFSSQPAATMGIDYLPVAAVLRFDDSNSVQCINITVIDDAAIVEDTEVFAVQLLYDLNTPALELTTAVGGVFITDNSRAVFTFDEPLFVVSEDVRTVTVRTSLIDGQLERTVNLVVEVIDIGSANASEFSLSNSLLAYSSGQTSLSFNVALFTDDDEAEGMEEILLRLSSIDPAVIIEMNETRMLIQDEEGIEVGFEAVSYQQSESASVAELVCVNISRPTDGPIGGVFSLGLSTRRINAGPHDFVINSMNQSVLTFSDVIRRQCFTVEVQDDNLPEGPTLFELVLSVIDSGNLPVTVRPREAEFNIVDDEADQVTCPTLIPPAFGRIRFQRRNSLSTINQPGATASYICNSGFHLTRPGQNNLTSRFDIIRTCSVNGEWDDVDPICVEITVRISIQRRSYTVSEGDGIAVVCVWAHGNLTGRQIEVELILISPRRRTGVFPGGSDFQRIRTRLSFDEDNLVACAEFLIFEDFIAEETEQIGVRLQGITQTGVGLFFRVGSTATVFITDNDNFCVSTPNGGCPLRRECINTLSGAQCGNCLEGFYENPDDGECLPFICISYQQMSYTVAEDAGEVTLCAEVVEGEGFRPNTSVELLAHTSRTGHTSRPPRLGATPGDDYVTTFTRLTFSEQNPVQCFNVTIVDDELTDNFESFFVELRNERGIPGIVSQGTSVDIWNDDIPEIAFEQARYFVRENATRLEIGVVLVAGTLARRFNLFLNTQPSGNNPARANRDYRQFGSVSFQPFAVVGDRATAVFRIFDDSTTEGVEEFTVIYNRATAVVQILDDEGIRVGFEQTELEVLETVGQIELCVSVGISQSPDGVIGDEFVLNVSTLAITAGNTDYQEISSVNQPLLLFSNTTTRQCFLVEILEDNIPEEQEKFAVLLSYTGGLPVTPDPIQAIITIADNDAVDCSNLSNPPNGFVSLSGRNPGSIASYSCSEGHVLVGNRHRTCIRNGQWSGSEPECIAIVQVGIQFNSYTVSEGDEQVTVCAQVQNGNMTGRSFELILTALRNRGQAGLPTTSPDYLATRGSLQFEEQNTFQCISILIFENTLVEGRETFRIELSNPRNIPGVDLTTTNVPVTILDNDRIAYEFGQPEYTIREGDFELEVEILPVRVLDDRRFPLTQSRRLRLNLEAVDTGSATVFSDYSRPPTGIHVSRTTANRRTVSIFITNDMIVEETESFLLQLSSDNPHLDIVGTNTTLVVIEDDDERVFCYEEELCFGNASVVSTQQECCNSGGFSCSTEGSSICSRFPCPTIDCFSGPQCSGNVFQSRNIEECCASGLSSTLGLDLCSSCESVECGSLPNPMNGEVVLTGTTFGSEASYSCSEGFELQGNTMRTCRANGQWSGSEPSCEVVECGSLPNPMNGEVVLTGTTFGSEASYSCSEGFELQGNTMRTCQANGQWSGSQPSCEAVECGSLPNPMNGEVVLTGTTFGSEATYSCSEQFELQGNTMRTCQANGQWSGSEPSCEVCSPLPNPENGEVQMDGNTTGSLADYRCNAGFEIRGNRTRVCQANAQWSGTEPECVAVECGSLPNPMNGEVVLTGTTFGSEATYSCSEGFELQGNTMRTCQANGQWSGREPSCEAVECGSLLNPMNGEVVLTGTTFGSEATYSCSEGFELQGNTMRTCQANGQWSGSEPSCEAVQCGNLRNPMNGEVVLTGTTFGSEATYSCSEQFELQGNTMRTCQANGQWSGSEPSCEVCSPLPNPENGEVQMDGNTTGSLADYRCNAGFEIRGNRIRVCQANAQWSGTEPECVAVECGSLPNPMNGEVVLTGTTFGSEATYSCSEGFELQGNTTRICEANGQWSGSQPSCEAVECGSLPNPMNGEVVLTGTTFGSEATYSCSEGFELQGNTTRTCQANGQWSVSEPSCEGSSTTNSATATMNDTSLTRLLILIFCTLQLHLCFIFW